MIYEIFVRFFGAGIAGLIQFLPFTINYNTNPPLLKIETVLSSPVTNETKRLVENGMQLNIQYDWSLIVNDSRAYHRSSVHKLQFIDNTWLIDGSIRTMSIDSLQKQIGTSVMALPGLLFDNGDRITVFTKAEILADSAFTRSTRMRTDVLWNYYTPKHKEQLIFNGEVFIPE
jgi:hypothetical protein